MAQVQKTKISIPYYTTYTHVYQLAKAIKEGAEQIPNVEVTLYRIPETLPQEVLEKMHAAPPTSDPEFTPELLTQADGVLFGFPTRFGSLPAQLKSFLDACGGLWASGALRNKFAGTFVSTSSQHGGQETTHLAMINFFAHNGMAYVPLGYASDHVGEDEELIGGSPYGASVIAGSDGSRMPNEKELDIARTQGRKFAQIVSTYVKGNAEVPEAPKEEIPETPKVESAEAEYPKVEAPKAEAPKLQSTEKPKSKSFFKRLFCI
ncbi:flavo protein WrbA [Conidiobolus coronatus NRRL 28638]|uniref:Flavo protein WrbA n=1 Tax=Conidiobolus coronatus (strain ATCC 28846 / CBS 209.66 / NRRL 28638) TaxID=796925 RepID=A0A137NYN0_CONC2|nr:flavo protein WrbA [Conidiobolus coronatus NRRL 28638]|eukprot:KXN67896.1 flavo protein WrbA [Conidiobolus coronatus NRRL 28638]